ncbi:MAG: phage tail tape measure protein [bacterium]
MGAVTTAAAKMKADSAFQFERSIAGIKTTAIALGENLLPAITDGANAISRFLGHINKFISNNPKAAGTIVKLTAAFGGLLTVGGTGMIVGGKLVQTVSKISSVYSANAPRVLDAVKGFRAWNAAGHESIMKAAGMNLNFKNIGKGLKNISSSAWDGAKSITSGFAGAVKGASGAIWKTTASLAAQAKALFFTKAGWVSMGGALKGGVVGAFKALIFPIKAVTAALLTNPIGLIALGIAGAALLLYKYWKPVKNFFAGIWSGIKMGLSPLKGSFDGIIKPLSSIWGWFKKLVAPVEATGKSFSIGADLGFAIGTAMGFVATAIGKVVKAFVWFVTAPARLVAAVAAFKNAGMSLPKAIWEGIKETASMPINAIKEMVGKIREFLPFSPAKVGPLKDLNKVKIVETIAGTIKPEPVRDAMQKVTGQISGAAPSHGGVGGGSSGSVVVNYSPTITIGSGTKEDVAGFSEMLNRHKDELMKIIDEVTRQKTRLAY